MTQLRELRLALEDRLFIAAIVLVVGLIAWQLGATAYRAIRRLR